jgi:Tfp pilus assembly protein PilN
MRAVNLIPMESRPGGGAGGAGRSGGAAYVLLGGLAILVVLIAAWTLTGRGLNDKRTEVSRLQREAVAAKAQSGQLAAYGRFAALRKARVDSVRTLAASRFDWATAMNAISRTIPADAWLTTMTGTVAPGVAIDGGSGATSSLRSALAVPAIEIEGCTPTQAKVARLIARLQAVPGVDRVSLADAVKSDPSGGGSGTSSGDCSGTHSGWPTFHMVLFFGRAVPTALPAAPQASTAGTAAPAATAAATTSSTTPSTPTTGASK